MTPTGTNSSSRASGFANPQRPQVKPSRRKQRRTADEHWNVRLRVCLQSAESTGFVSVSDVLKAYLHAYELNHRPEFARVRAEAPCTCEPTARHRSLARPERSRDSRFHQNASKGRRCWPHDKHGTRGTESGDRTTVVDSLAEGTKDGRTERCGQGAVSEKRRPVC